MTSSAYEEALAAYDIATRLDPTSAYTYNNKGNARTLQITLSDDVSRGIFALHSLKRHWEGKLHNSWQIATL